MIWIIPIIILAIQPGLFLVKRFNLAKSVMGIAIALALSVGLNGALLYYASQITPITSLSVWIYSLLLSLLFIVETPHIKKLNIKIFQDKQETIVISVGGSLLVPDDVDYKFISRLRDFLLPQTESGRHFVLVAGGGKTARRYRDAAAHADRVSLEDLDEKAINQNYRINVP